MVGHRNRTLFSLVDRARATKDS